MIGVGTSLLFDRRAGKAGPPIPPFNKAMVDAWFMSGLSNAGKPGSITGVMGNDGMKALLHEETYNMLVPPIMMLSEGEGVVEGVVYPYPLMDENEINGSDDWVNDKVI